VHNVHDKYRGKVVREREDGSLVVLHLSQGMLGVEEVVPSTRMWPRPTERGRLKVGMEVDFRSQQYLSKAACQRTIRHILQLGTGASTGEDGRSLRKKRDDSLVLEERGGPVPLTPREQKAALARQKREELLQRDLDSLIDDLDRADSNGAISISEVIEEILTEIGQE